MRFFEIFARILTKILLPVFLCGTLNYGIIRYVEIEKSKVETKQAEMMINANIKALCIQKHACGDDCKDI